MSIYWRGWNKFKYIELLTGGTLKQGTSASPLTLTAGTPIFSLYSTNSGTSGSTSAEPFYIKSTLTGAGQVGGRSRFHTYSNVASGGWVNALKGYMEFGASGRTTGLASAVCAETVLSAGTVSGAYAALEAELVLGTGASTGGQTSFLYCNATGADASTFDTNGYFFHIGDGITAAAGKFCGAYYQSLKCYFTDGATTRYMFLSQVADGIGLGTSGTPQAYTAGTPPMAMYFTNAGTSGSTSAEPFYLKSTLTGVGQVGGRARFHCYSNVASGGWVNALKGYMEFGASGSTSGLASAICAELSMPGAAASGTYAPLEVELVTPASNTTNATTSFIYFNVTGDSTAVTSFNTNGHFIELGSGIVDTADGVLDAITSDATPVFEYRLRFKALGVSMYMPVSTNPTFAG